MLKVLKCVPFDIAAAAEAVAVVGLVAMAAASVSVATTSAPAAQVPRAATTGVAALVAIVAVVTTAVAVVIATTVASAPAVPGSLLWLLHRCHFRLQRVLLSLRAETQMALSRRLVAIQSG